MSVPEHNLRDQERWLKLALEANASAQRLMGKALIRRLRAEGRFLGS